MSLEQATAKQLLIKFNSRLFNEGHNLPKKTVKEFVLITLEEAEILTDSYLKGIPLDLNNLREEVKKL